VVFELPDGSTRGVRGGAEGHILDAAPANDYAHYCLGRCLARMGQPRLAAGHYKMAFWLRPDVDYYREAAGVDS